MNIRLFVALMAAIVFSSGCASSTSPAGNEGAPGLRLAEVAQLQSVQPPGGAVTGLALGGGGVRGFAHIGVLRALEEHQIPIEVVVGSSVGSVVGAGFAAGLSSAEMKEIALQLKPESLADWQLSLKGMLKGERIRNWSASLARHIPIESLPRRYGAVATDLRSGDPVILTTGSVGDAVRASVGVPGMIPPVVRGEQMLSDGGIKSLVPVRFTKAMGATRVIAVDVFCGMDSDVSDRVTSVLQRAFWIQSCAMSDGELSEADLVIRVSMKLKSFSSFSQAQEMIDAGYAEAVRVLDSHPQLVAALRAQTPDQKVLHLQRCCDCRDETLMCEHLRALGRPS